MPPDGCEVERCRLPNRYGGIQSGLYRVNSVYVRIDPVVDNASSFITYQCEISTALPSPLCRCIAHINTHTNLIFRFSDRYFVYIFIFCSE